MHFAGSRQLGSLDHLLSPSPSASLSLFLSLSLSLSLYRARSAWPVPGEASTRWRVLPSFGGMVVPGQDGDEEEALMSYWGGLPPPVR